MKTSYLIQAIIKEAPQDDVIRYFAYSSEAFIFGTRFGSARLSTLSETNEAFDRFLNEALRPVEHKTLFPLVVQNLIGGEHGHRDIGLILRIISVKGNDVMEFNPSIVSEVKLRLVEKLGTLVTEPYSIVVVTPQEEFVPNIKVVLDDNQIGEFNLTVPPMESGDHYISTRVIGDTVAHHSADENGKINAMYVCTKQGNLMYKQQ